MAPRYPIGETCLSLLIGLLVRLRLLAGKAAVACGGFLAQLAGHHASAQYSITISILYTEDLKDTWSVVASETGWLDADNL